MNHKNSWSEESTAPEPNDRPQRKIIISNNNSSRTIPSNDIPKDILIVASKLKKYVKDGTTISIRQQA